MKLSAQIGRGLIGLTFGVAIAAYAAAGTSDDEQGAPKVAHSRLEIVTLPSAQSDPRWAVASVRVGDPVVKTTDRRVAQHARLSGANG